MRTALYWSDDRSPDAERETVSVPSGCAMDVLADQFDSRLVILMDALTVRCAMTEGMREQLSTDRCDTPEERRLHPNP